MPLDVSQIEKIIANEERLPIYRIKIVTVGASRAGKSCLIRRYCEERFIKEYIPTVGVDYGVKPIEISGKDVNENNEIIANTTLDIRANFFDLGGSDDYLEIRSDFYSGAQGILFIYDQSQPATLTAILKYYEEYVKYSTKTASTKGGSSTNYPEVEYGIDKTKVYLIGTKSDIPTRVTPDDITYVAKKIKADKAYVCSALTGENVGEMFEEVFLNVTKECFIW